MSSRKLKHKKKNTIKLQTKIVNDSSVRTIMSEESFQVVREESKDNSQGDTLDCDNWFRREKEQFLKEREQRNNFMS